MDFKKLLITASILLFLSMPLLAKHRMDFLLFNLSQLNNPQGNFRKMSKEFTLTMAPMFYGEAHTGGASGFELGIGYSLSKISTNKSYWKNAIKAESSGLKVPAFFSGVDFHITKGFGFGLKLFGNLRYYVFSSMISSGLGFEYCVNEGLEFVPDISIGMGYNRLFGSNDLNMQMLDLRLKISKSFVLGREVKIIPIIAYSHLFSWASANRLGGYFDYTDETDATVLVGVKGDLFYLSKEAINLDRLFFGFKIVKGLFGFNFETAIPINYLSSRPINVNTGISFIM